jgi:hypothetical protein
MKTLTALLWSAESESGSGKTGSPLVVPGVIVAVLRGAFDEKGTGAAELALGDAVGESMGDVLLVLGTSVGDCMISTLGAPVNGFPVLVQLSDGKTVGDSMVPELGALPNGATGLLPVGASENEDVELRK